MVTSNAVADILTNYLLTTERATDNDNQTKTYTLENGYRYMLIASHPYNAEFYFGIVTVFESGSSITKIYQTGTLITVSINRLVITVQCQTSIKVHLITIDRWL